MRPSPTPRLRRTSLALLAGLSLFGMQSCSIFGEDDPDSYKAWADRTPEMVSDNHWNLGSVPERIAYSLSGYRSEDWDTYRDFQYSQKQEINTTLRRHFLNRNPVSPLQAHDVSYGSERPPHSIWPRPDNYFHLTSLVVGGALSASSAGVFLPIPVDSLIATVEPGGWQEFKDGLTGGEQPISRHTRKNPPATSEFELNTNASGY